MAIAAVLQAALHARLALEIITAQKIREEMSSMQASYCPQSSPNRSHSGFTLIEVLITVVILLTVVGGSMAAFVTFNDRQTLRSSGKELQLLLRSAQTKARVSEVPAGCSALQGYRVFAPGGEPAATVELFALCGATRDTAVTLSPARSSFKLPSNIVVQDELQVDFYTLYGGVRIGTGAPASADIVLSMDGGSTTYTFTITQGGEITDGEIN